MISLKNILTFVCLNIISFGIFASASTEVSVPDEVEVKEVKIESELSELSTKVHEHSYAPIKYTVTNRTDKPYHSKLWVNRSIGGGSGANQVFSATTPPFAKKTFYFYPICDSNYLSINSTDSTPAHTYINSAYTDMSVAVSSECRETWLKTLNASSSYVSADLINITDWLADYRTFACFDFLIIPEKQYNNKLDESYRKAIRLWIAAGGHLLLIGDATTVESTKRYGNGKISIAPERMNMEDDARIKWFNKLTDRKEHYHYVGANESTDKYIERRFPKIIDVNKYKIPPPPVFLGLILLAFAIFVGPICLKVLAPVGKRFRLFYIIPLSAVGVSLLLALLIFVIDGTGGVGTRKVHFFINAADHTGLITQTQVVRTNLILSDEFHLPMEVAISGERNSDGYHESMKDTQREDEVCSGGYFPSRASVVHYLLQPVVTRWALHVEKTSDGKYSFQSSFPAQLSNVTYTDNDGKVWMVKSLMPGQKLTAESVYYKGKFKPTSGSFRANMVDKDGKTGVIPTLDSIEWEKTEIIVSGPIAFNN